MGPLGDMNLGRKEVSFREASETTTTRSADVTRQVVSLDRTAKVPTGFARKTQVVRRKAGKEESLRKRPRRRIPVSRNEFGVPLVLCSLISSSKKGTGSLASEVHQVHKARGTHNTTRTVRN